MQTTCVRPLALLALAALAWVSACKPPPAAPGPEPAPVRPPAAVVAMDLGGQKVLVMPVQSAAGVGASREQITAEVVFALREWDSRTTWVTPDQLRAALRRSPGYAPDPAALPTDSWMHHGERYVVAPLVTQLRRYTALMDARLVLVLRDARFLPVPDGSGGVVRLSAGVVDSRNGNVIWFGDADGETRPQADAAGLASAAAALAARMVVRSDR
ncbi:MAG TPA: hypothetical protein VEW03_01145 [Longimicrobiaceae bacterium]|nr:hypothetical protein [Longimicrobiaceae bacterium]